MICLLQQSRCNKNSFAVTHDTNKATHYDIDEVFKGEITPQIIENYVMQENMQNNLQNENFDFDKEPLVMPSMNFENEKDKNDEGENELPLPCMSFGDKKNKIYDESDESVLPLPRMF